MNSVEKLMQGMGQENISSDEYKDMLAKFQVRIAAFMILAQI